MEREELFNTLRGVVLGSGFDMGEKTNLLNKITEVEIEIEELESRDSFLNCLEACGVDNWCGYGDAQEMYDEDEEV